MGILTWIVFGLIAGAIAQLLLPGDDAGSNTPVGWIITMVIGIVGAVVGGFIGTALGFGDVDGFNFSSFLIAVGGALLVLLVWRFIATRMGSHGGTGSGVAHPR